MLQVCRQNSVSAALAELSVFLEKDNRKLIFHRLTYIMEVEKLNNISDLLEIVRYCAGRSLNSTYFVPGRANVSVAACASSPGASSQFNPGKKSVLM